MSFREEWLKAVKDKRSVLCAGIDPPEFEMGRDDKGLPKDVFKRDWAVKYLQAVAPSCAAIKPNAQYWKSQGFDNDTLIELGNLAHELGLVVIDDSKLADIGASNDAGIYGARKREANAVTVAPFAGNLEEIANQGRNRGVGIISMCLMSNPEYEREKNMLVPTDDLEGYHPKDIIDVDGSNYVRRYIQLAHDARAFGVDGVVIGAPKEIADEKGKRFHPTLDEIENVRKYVGEKMLVLLPGVGAQGGEADTIWEYFGSNNVMVNVGRSLMFPEGSNSTPKDQAEKAKEYRDMLNQLRFNAK